MRTNFNLTDEQYNEILMQYANEYFSENNPDNELFSMDEFDEFMSGQTPTWIAQRIYFGEFNPNDDYFYFNGYANLESTSYPE